MSRQKILAKASFGPTPKTYIIDPQVARKDPLLFGFKHLDLKKGKFICDSGDGGSLIYIFQTLCLFSKIERMNLERNYPQCHLVPDDQVKKHNLHTIVAVSKNGRVHQLGRRDTPERIVGYFDNPMTNLFQICLLDLKHNLSGN